MTRSLNATDYRIWLHDATENTYTIELKSSEELFAGAATTTLAYSVDPTHQIRMTAAAWNGQFTTYTASTGGWNHPEFVIYANLTHAGEPVPGEELYQIAIPRPDCPV